MCLSILTKHFLRKDVGNRGSRKKQKKETEKKERRKKNAVWRNLRKNVLESSGEICMIVIGQEPEAFEKLQI